ncbi:ATP-binding protein [Streptomyces sp. NPDC057702]|uniref:ATP-binding protein n=1 Tax=unclassified Streptomyces TaxID=2593676 RepID=UPI0036B3EA78
MAYWVPVVVNELATNAVEHNAGVPGFDRMRVALGMSGQAVLVSVTDEGVKAGIPRQRVSDDQAENGRGLSLVASLAERLVFHETPHGYRVTAELLAPGR